MTYKIKSRVWIEGEGGAFLGEGRVQLLERIMEMGSMSKAAKSMGMSYKKAWTLVDSINSQAEIPLVVKKTGGAGGGGAAVTEAGKRAISLFKSLNEGCREFLDSTYERKIIKF